MSNESYQVVQKAIKEINTFLIMKFVLSTHRFLIKTVVLHIRHTKDSYASGACYFILFEKRRHYPVKCVNKNYVGVWLYLKLNPVFKNS